MTSLKYWNGSSWETIVLGATGATGGTAYGDASQIITGQLAVANGGTGSNNASGAATNLNALSYSNFADSRYGSSTAYEVLTRMSVNNVTSLGTNGAPTVNTSRVTLFTPYKTMTVSSLTTFGTSNSTDSGGTPVRRMGLFTVSGTTFTCIARTASDATLWNTASTIYTRTLEASFGNTDASGYVVLNAGVTYGFGIVAYNGTAANFVAPSVASYTNPITGAATLMNTLTPAMAYFGALTDFTGAGQTMSTSSFAMPYGRLGLV